MSRAFIREPEPAEPRCPGCGALGDSVGRVTLEAHLPPDACSAIGDSAFYCVNSDCQTAYFNGWGTAVSSDRLTATAYPKDPGGPICSCFGITAADIRDDAREGHKERVRDLLERSRDPNARCVERSPDGRSCISRVLRLFRETFEAG